MSFPEFRPTRAAPAEEDLPRAGILPGRRELNLFLLGKGVVGHELLLQIRGQRERLRRRQGIELVVVGIADSERAIFDEGGVDLDRALVDLSHAPVVEGSPLRRFVPLLRRLERLPSPALVDCTAAEGMEALYLEAFSRRIHVVAANKRPLTIPWEARAALFRQAADQRVGFHYETTVGASLPVIDTLQDLLRSGDEVRRIEASLSGTLGFLCAEIERGRPLSVAVREARALGYSEPDPREDLAGIDVMRKALILARELGMEISEGAIELFPFVSAQVLEGGGLEDFHARLEASDEEVQRELERWRREGRVLRYLAEIVPPLPGRGEARVRVGPIPVPLDHPAAGLRGTESMVSFTTARHDSVPLTVRGAGAGGAVTAAGVLIDILRLVPPAWGRWQGAEPVVARGGFSE